ncbi:glycosyltransferase family 1 protein [Lichtheimia corymbifera JMRC:FSU:9682]|uniref:UDP-N-acetylglucosamine transferase subunit ALG13 n=1 Tax=Lichtheimia corymbifera JMRC:FSU:9682 TaxID=1263082 RepID=A0A068RQN1_9FUNG|nr:glycosyltransferase family 1 protein [Lichtheimia corymbifera JMRC:FSU:9682]
MSVFVTVGSTGFDELVDVVTTGSFLSALKSLGYSSAVIQYGSSEHVYTRNVNQLLNGGIKTEGYAYKPSIEDDMKRASLIISHAGSGSMLQALRLHKRLIVVSNTSLMDNHQVELAQAMQQKNYCCCSAPNELVDAVRDASTREMEPFPSPATDAFTNLLDHHMGFH